MVPPAMPRTADAFSGLRKSFKISCKAIARNRQWLQSKDALALLQGYHSAADCRRTQQMRDIPMASSSEPHGRPRCRC